MKILDSYNLAETRIEPSKIGFCEWFRVGEYERVERALKDLESLSVERLRFGFSWADYFTPEGPNWYRWLIPKLAERVEALPCFTYTPPSLGIQESTASPPRNPKDYADFVDHALNRFGKWFEWVELWNEPNNLNDWDFRLDPHWEIFSDMVTKAAYWCQHRGYKTLLGGMAETDASWLSLMGERGVLQNFDAIGVHGFPGTWDFAGFSWERNIESAREVLHRFESKAAIWITEAGYSTWRHDERQQASHLLDIMRLPADRIYLYQLHDLHPDLPHQDGLREDLKHYHFGLKKADGTPKLSFRIWEERGLDGLKSFADSVDRPFFIGRKRQDRPAVVFGGAGFVGTNLVSRLCKSGRKTRIFDNLSRPGVERNLDWLLKEYPDQIDVDVRDVRDPQAVKSAVADAACVYHFAAQVAVTTSLIQPSEDFSVNAAGTVNILEALRTTNPAPLLFTSTNKVYGGLDSIGLERQESRYVPSASSADAVDESFPLDFKSPYGCSKGAADQYVLDYANSYGLPAVVFRMSCIYGPHQWGTEDQGWVAHFLRSAMRGEPINIYGDGRQVRDILYVDDLTAAMTRAIERIDAVAGKAFNIGGGKRSSISLLELVELMRNELGLRFDVRFDDWRESDQRYYISRTERAERNLGWKPLIKPRQGVRQLCDWLRSELDKESEQTEELARDRESTDALV